MVVGYDVAGNYTALMLTSVAEQFAGREIDIIDW